MFWILYKWTYALFIFLWQHFYINIIFLTFIHFVVVVYSFSLLYSIPRWLIYSFYGRWPLGLIPIFCCYKKGCYEWFFYLSLNTYVEIETHTCTHTHKFSLSLEWNLLDYMCIINLTRWCQSFRSDCFMPTTFPLTGFSVTVAPQPLQTIIYQTSKCSSVKLPHCAFNCNFPDCWG